MQTDTKKGPERILPGARSALVLLIIINLFNYIDRQVLAAVEPEIRSEYLSHLPEAEAKLLSGLLYTAFLITYMVIAPLFGILADRYSRWVLVGFGVIVWSVASGASGVDWGLSLLAGFWILLITRCFVGFGEGAYGPVAPTMLSDYFPVSKRGWVMACFYMAIPVGGALGYTLGEVAEMTLGWRWAFYLVVPPGILLGVWCFFMPEPPRGQADVADAPAAGEVPFPPLRKFAWRDYLGLFRIPSYVLDTLGMTAMTFAIGALAYWMPDYLEFHGNPTLLGMGPRTAFGAITAVAGLSGTLLGGLAGDWLQPRLSGSYFIVSGIALSMGCPMLLMFLITPFPWAWIFAFITVFCLFFNTGPTNTILANVTHPSVRASGFAINILIIHACGDAISPAIVGYLAGKTSRDTGFIMVSTIMVLGGLLWLWGARYLKRDTELAPTRLG